jgi:hypothetical protein
VGGEFAGVIIIARAEDFLFYFKYHVGEKFAL